MNRRQYNLQWERGANGRRLLLLTVIVTFDIIASGYMAMALPHRGTTVLEVAIVFFFALLFGWISIGFWTSLLGFFTLLRERGRWDLTRLTEASVTSGLAIPPTAMLMPVYNEDAQQVFGRLVAIIKSLQQTGRSASFDVFALSDTTDPDLRVAEEIAWEAACRQTYGFGRLYYRHRSPNIKRKSGNIADFCRRWGTRYRYMVVLDADSVMSGRTLVRVVQMMERDPSIGILQTAPVPVGKSSLLARLQQFSAQMYGPLFAAGLHFWQLGDAQYWGHNAIIRVEPFMKHCALPRLSGLPPLGGDILSHDFVEAALMRRAGWGVWLAFDLDGSYEEPPPTLIAELIRDRRWCQGNLQHLRILFTRGLFPAHRYLFLNGAMAYISAVLWLIFLTLSTILAVVMAIFEPDYFPNEGSLFPHWQVWHPAWMVVLLMSTLVILFLPKVLSLILAVAVHRRSSDFGGIFRAILSLLVEIICSTLLAPLRMLAHSKFVIVTLLGGKIGWNAATRVDKGTGWGRALRFHGGGMVLGLGWGGLVFLINRQFFWWLVPILAPLILAVPISVLASRPSIGKWMHRLGIFLTQAEVAPPAELQLAHQSIQALNAAIDDMSFPQLQGFARAVVDPTVKELHFQVRPRKSDRLSPPIAERLDRLVKRAATAGPQSLTASEKNQLLNHPIYLEALHCLVWELHDIRMARHWGLA